MTADTAIISSQVDTASISCGDPVPSSDELVRRATAMVPKLRAQADEVEEARMVPRETIEQFKQAGFFRILQPKRWGGWEMNPIVFMRILMELGRGCSSSAWNMMILGIHQWEFGLMDPRAGDDVWGKDNTTIIASSYPPAGKLTRVEGGYLLNGRWPTSSGTDHGQWAFIGANQFDASGAMFDRKALLVPRTDYEIFDDWFVFGLAGTGSKSLILKDVFVPEHRAHSMVDYRSSGRSEMYLYPFNMVFFSAVSSVIIGFAQAAVDIFREQMQTRRDTATGLPTALSPYVKDRLGNAVARIRSSRMRLEQVMNEATQHVTRRELVPLDDRVHYMLDGARVGRECEEAVLLLYKSLSARGIYKSNPMQRVLRDVLAGANHITQNADDFAGILGGYLLGQPLPPFMYELPAVTGVEARVPPSGAGDRSASFGCP
ncbi:3-hydroxy-9,10-secoandrosta-1,3,5(10)-triene-9, 17-dione monooxygenase [Methylocella tundrae]|uniref:3-hydroxy-9,10-secoandrosta-1,3,5(10)-triene-9, 17-dione monooxygenase n=1 Tax=Methylocella tundrae TaxID=227605 RepID=A0A8B6MAN1_METTU|nr:acyl-CoA dehydrogenase family protein [Methylocella tundrae]VTZ27584.1 Acyl-CoA dehydrogenase [Methylocella tundrae]VTZ51142.1 3-hydroxy-9,10-secoandrosta-1,3,5(10)-triene-9, 17-dione monooxygenase [Methylocella tundrae]